MDTLVVFCALIFTAAILSFLSTNIARALGLVSDAPERRQKPVSAAYIMDPFEPADTQNMHFDPRLIQRNMTTPVPARSTAVAVARPQGRVIPRRPVLPTRRLTQRPERLLAC